MKEDLNRSARILLAGLIVFYILSVLLNLGHLNLQGEEPRRAVVSIEMLESGDYIVPHALGWEYYNKPPLFNWILAGLIYLTGSTSEFVLRLPSLLFLLLWAYFHYEVSRRFFSKKIALLSAFFMLTVPDLFFYGLANGAEIDIFYSFLVYLQVISIFWFYHFRNYWLLFAVSWFFCAAGFLTKGFPSLIFQVLTLGALCVYAKSIRIVFKPAHLAGIATFALVTGAYFYAYSTRAPLPVLLTNLVNESLGKWDSGTEKAAAGIQAVAVYPLSLLKLLAPWSVVLPILLWKRKLNLQANPLVKFSILFILFNIWVYWFASSTKLRYVYVFVPFAMNVIIAAFEDLSTRYPKLVDKFLRYGALLFILVFVGLLVLPFYYAQYTALSLIGAAMLGIFLFIYFQRRFAQWRVWLFITGLVLVRFTYALVGIPIQKESMFDYEKQAAVVFNSTKGEQLTYYLPPDSLRLDIILFDTLFKWRSQPVTVAPSLYHQWPYYYYKVSGQVLKYDSSLKTGNLYMTTSDKFGTLPFNPLLGISNQSTGDSLAIFRR